MRVLLIAQYFPPEIGAAASRWGDYVDILVQRGHKVTVLCGMPNYPQGKRFDGYNNLWVKREKKSSNLRIIRSAVWANDRKSTFKMLGNYLSFAFSGVMNAIKIRNVDLIILSSPPLFVGIIGMILSSIRKYKMLLDVRDIWPESVVVLGGMKSKWLIKLGRLLESKVYRSASGYIFPVPGFQKYFKSHHPLQMKKPMFNLMNGVHEDFLVKTKETQLASQKDFTVLYSGNMGMAQGLEVVLEAASQLKDYPIQFKLIGDGVCKTSLIQMAKSMGLSNMTFLDSISRETLISEMHNASVCLVPLKNYPLFRNAIPSKILEIMACKKPVILGVEGEAATIIERYDCGTVVPPENAKALKNAILNYYENKELIKLHRKNSQKGVLGITKRNLMGEFLFELENTKIFESN